MIPKDPVMLLSYVNMQLRDQYFSLEELCKSLQLDETELREQLASIDYQYDEVSNQFV